MAWVNTSPTCISVYGTLLELEQINARTSLEDAGLLIMTDLQFYNATASNDIIKADALALSKSMLSMLSNSFGGVYQTAYNAATAATALVAVLTDATKTVENLSDSVDLILTFS
jgi:hypothetical protein